LLPLPGVLRRRKRSTHAIRKSFPGVGQNIKEFVEKNTGVKVKTTGQKVKMRYHAA